MNSELVIHQSSQLSDQLNSRRSVEDNLTLAQASSTKQTQLRSESLSCSAQDLIHSGAYKGSEAKKIAELDITRHKRLEAYMSVNSRTIAQTRGWRIRSAYRLVRYMGYICGGLTGPMMLSTLFNSDFLPDPSTYPFQPPTRTDVYGMSYIIETLSKLEGLPDSYTLSTPQGTMSSGFTYLPPAIPDLSYGVSDPRTLPYLRGQEPANYDPELDQPLNIWLDAYDHLSEKLRLSEGTVGEPQAGVFGTVGMFSTNSARLLWPTRDELLMYEQEIMLRIFDDLCKHSVQKVEEMVIGDLGYGRIEAVMLVKTALRYGTGVYESDIDMAKVRELKSMEVIADIAKAGDDPRCQIAARKQIQLVAGLTKDSSMEESEQFRSLAAKALDDKDELEF